MSYQVTARKWRPQTFDDVVEQQHVTRTLKNAIRLNRVAHAYLFAGTRGVGKTTMARVLAKALNCEHGPTSDPCGTCSACLEITQGASMDIVEIDGASNRGIDEIRDLRETLRYLPSRGRYKVYIIDEVHMLTKEAFNALLKTLEEPPPHVVFIFATTELDKIPHTIISRCQRFEFKRVSLSGIVSQLEHIIDSEGISISSTSLLRIAKAAEGSMRDAQSLFDQVVAYTGAEVDDREVGHLLGSVGSETLAQCLSAIIRQDAETALRTVDALQDEGHDAVAIIRALQEGLRHLIVLKTTDHPADLIPLSEADIDLLQQVAESASVEDIYGLFQVLVASEQSLRGAGNPFLVLEMAVIRMARIGRVSSLDSILGVLQNLEKDLPNPADALRPMDPVPALPSTPEPLATPAPVPPPPAVPQQAAPVDHENHEKPPRDRPRPPASPLEPAASPVPKAEPVPEPMPTLESVPEPVAAPDDFWQALQENVTERRPMLGGFLQPGQVLTHSETELIIGFAKGDDFFRSSLMDRENLSVVQAAAEAVSGRSLEVKIVSLDDPKGHRNQTEVGSVETSRNTSAHEALQQRKREVIQSVVDIFEGTIIT
ncbi:MAG: DNA polymerase III subunit gamma/tau [Candidatus Entotheonella factor]|uniref:DNA polymerase III subunit gamma/tau n=1 Tax=Entotheonella factor TaxID=1429438 RepID=W4LLF7_ENTF1|nr:MAG: DNA polymerase III subunit gamma/tau [Candidatus Entotheonella factor]